MNTEPIYCEENFHIDHKLKVFYKNRIVGTLFINGTNNKYLFNPKSSTMLSQNCLNLLSSAINQLNKD